VQVLLSLEGEVVRTLQGIKKGIVVLDERRAELRDEEAAKPDDDAHDADEQAESVEQSEAADVAPSGRW
jgi:hypothetical protein